MRVRVRYEKAGKLRFISAIDLGRVWERALRKAGLPIAYSEGFSPHPKVSFVDALPLGYASRGEYAELTFATALPLEPSMAALNAAFPAGIGVLAAQEVAEGAPKLAKRLQASCWDLGYPAEVDPDQVSAAVAAALASSELLVERERKGESTTVDLRPAVHGLYAQGSRVRAVLHHVEPQVRPTELHLALAAHGAPAEPDLVTRVAQGLPVQGGLEEALEGGLVPLDPREDAGPEDFPELKKAIP
ncbi:MAG TPA: TIGR03936 family radical SAM-associated protein [Deinococcales bacterium]|nr:TIGR03936 family radical SAM-associated protein [Deinococcales bacterium]